MSLGSARVMATIPAQNLARARQYYAATLRLTPAFEFPTEGALFSCGNGSWFLLYETQFAGTAEHTVAAFVVEDLDATMADLRSRGVVFEDYDLPGLKTVNGVATIDDTRGAWFKDSESNILAINELPAAVNFDQR